MGWREWILGVFWRLRDRGDLIVEALEVFYYWVHWMHWIRIKWMHWRRSYL